MSEESQNPSEIEERARELAERVEDQRRKGSLSSARRAFSQNWRDAVPELPLRFSVILVRPERDALAELLRRMRKHAANPPELRLHRASAELVEVRLGRMRIGDLPAQDAKLLKELGADAKLYRPQLIEIRNNERGKLDYVAIELVRPEIHYCSSCGAKHDGTHVNCEDCRRKRRKRGEAIVDQPPVAFHEAIDAIVEAPAHDEDELGI